ncbi:hypothetical protein QR680_009586 [Steinernema hermaphroditum]|uniref:Uncharacterized protein n=1 Tax=Steinernema hermaphroditum TaxID=289476 RepID=A0AA39IMN0_9BILA|nr:hypothetical protein QR680_009586 [Steinernema hermaphroditum]
MSGGVAGRVALVTNVSAQLGYAVARRLGMAGAQVIVSDENAKKTSDAVEGLRGIGVKVLGGVADISSADHRRALLELIDNKFQHLDIVVLNAEENTVKGDIVDATKMEFERTYDRYLTTPFRMCQQAYPLLSKSHAAQTAVLGMVKALSISAGGHGIRVNSVCSGMVSGDGTGAVWTAASEETENQIKNMVPLGRIGRITECAGIVEFLASDRAKYITGENCVVSGGVSVRI